MIVLISIIDTIVKVSIKSTIGSFRIRRENAKKLISFITSFSSNGGVKTKKYRVRPRYLESRKISEMDKHCKKTVFLNENVFFGLIRHLQRIVFG